MKNPYRLLDLAKIVINEIIDYVASYLGTKKFKVDIVKELVLKEDNKNSPQAILDTIDNFGWNKAFLMNIGDEKGFLLERAIKEKNPKNCLELGVYLGYSSIRILRNLNEDSMLTSIEASSKYYEISQEIVSHSGLSNQWNPLKGRAKNVIPLLNEKYDFVFLDHWKDEYLSDLKTLQSLGLLNDGATILADNVVLFNMEDYLSYVRNSLVFESKFISTNREYSKTEPDGIEISIFKKDD
jgi:catechol O-methyltransferase